MSDLLTVLRKEVRELWGNRMAARGPLFQAAVAIVVTGVLMPSSGPHVWSNPRVMALPFLMLGSVLSASVAADTFAGERERRTLETLLATPLSDRSILLGKIGAAVLFAASVMVGSLLAGFVVVNVAQRASPLYLPPIEMVGALLGGAIAASLVTASLAVAVSMRVPVARSAQQISAMISMLLAAAVGTIVSRAQLDLSWELILRIDVWLAMAGIVGVRIAGRLFQRERFFESP